MTDPAFEALARRNRELEALNAVSAIIGRGLMARPRLLMLDEPSLGLAPVVVKLIFEVLAQINRDGTTILLVEQNVARALDLADHAWLLETGSTVMSGTAKELRDNEQVRRSYLGF